MGAPADFTLTLRGAAFTPASEVSWAGSPRPTTWINSGQLSAAISAADVSALASYPVSVIDPELAETQALYFRVVEQVYFLNLPVIRR